MADAAREPAGRDRLVKWTDAKGREHEVPAYVAHLLKTTYRGQSLEGLAAKKTLAFFEQEAVFLLKNTLTKDPADSSQVKTRFVDLLCREPIFWTTPCESRDERFVEGGPHGDAGVRGGRDQHDAAHRAPFEEQEGHRRGEGEPLRSHALPVLEEVA
mmetsp:Transcript_18343/g.63178  ORF Transcript_18343/g.63178 Transcript_18343/m.63178 type:complete len:157 (-) Transcript_18343:265-735(-)